MANQKISILITIIIFTASASLPLSAKNFTDLTFESGHISLQHWLLPTAPQPVDNKTSTARVELGKMLFFDTRLSGDGNMSCATCHNPLYGWSDGLKTAKGFKSQVLGRASPTIINTAYNSLQMWDGRKKSLEDQAMGPMMSSAEMNTDVVKLLTFLNQSPGYRSAFKQAYPKEKIDELTIAKSIASFERTVISNDSPFDRWVKGDKHALTKQQINGFKLFVNPQKGNCVTCHSAPNFTDNGFHNIGLTQFGTKNSDMGRYTQKPLRLMKGAFKTPTLRDITLTAPYFHDGSEENLTSVVSHYNVGGKVKNNLSPNMKNLDLNKKEQRALVEFMISLTSKKKPFLLPVIPL